VEKIIGGAASLVTAAAAIGIRNTVTGAQSICSAALIRRDAALSAAHCFIPTISGGTVTGDGISAPNILANTWFTAMDNGVYHTQAPTVYISTVRIHPEWGGSGSNPRYDLALVWQWGGGWSQIQHSYTDNEVFGLNVDQINELWSLQQRGWGSSNNNGSGSGQLRYHNVMKNTVGIKYTGAIETTRNSMFPGGTCAGDSGGPLTLDKVANGLSGYVLVGIHSTAAVEGGACQKWGGEGWKARTAGNSLTWIEGELAFFGVSCSLQTDNGIKYKRCY
jgi:hypothetical protein